MREKREEKERQRAYKRFAISQNIVVRAPWTNEAISEKTIHTFNALPLQQQFAIVGVFKRASSTATKISNFVLASLNPFQIAQLKGSYDS